MLFGALAGTVSLADAETMTGKRLLELPDDYQRYMYIAGIVAGLSIDRYVRDGNDAGSACIDSWFYDTDGIKDTLYAAFDKFGDKSPAAIILALATRKCGE
jgi:hypothetical protein